MTAELDADGVRLKVMRMRFLIPTLIIVLLLAACSGDDEETTTLPEDGSSTATTLAIGGGGSDTDDSSDTTVSEDSTTTTVETPTLPGYDIVHRSPGDNGDLLVVVLQDVADGVTDHDLEQVILDVVDTFGPVAEAHILDDASVLDLVLADPADLSDEQLADLDAHYLLRLVDGTSVSFRGPFEDVPGYEIGS
ncbi:MAG: hypothetical protein HKN95_11100 [Acidimicrobiia bacterium]|jgi:hypothetical protein|nr:hypothetical protein [Acidimicrobiia bacterium]